jgi:hypothetical protein
MSTIRTAFLLLKGDFLSPKEEMKLSASKVSQYKFFCIPIKQNPDFHDSV